MKTLIDDTQAPALDDTQDDPEAPALVLVLTADETAEVMAFVRKAAPMLDELGEYLPKLRALAPMLAQVAEGGPAGLMGLLGAVMRG
jgi:hypothetical protein